MEKSALERKNGLTVTLPEGAQWGLYWGVPGAFQYDKAIASAQAVTASCVTEQAGQLRVYYAAPDCGVYHFAASKSGHTAVCQVLNVTKEKLAAGMQLNIRLEKLAGSGYEAGYVMCCTEEFNRACLESEKSLWGEGYACLFRTPFFLRQTERPGRHQQTTNEELMEFVERLARENDGVHLYSLGKSPKYGYDMPLVLFTRENVTGMTLEQAAQCIRGNGKPTVQYTAQCHSTEPASAEGALAMMLALCEDFGREILMRADVYIIPRINPDGAFEVIRRSPTTGEDMNRDYLRMHNPEIRMVTAAYNLFLPEVAIDGHEKRNDLLTEGAGICADLEMQVGAGACNHPAAMTELAMKMALSAMENARRLGLRSRFYRDLASAAGGSAGSSYFGTRNSLSFLVETPGQAQLGTYFMERRVMGHYVPASSIIRYAAENSGEILATVHGSRETMGRTGPVYDEENVIVLEHGKEETGSWATPQIHVPTGQVVDPEYTCPYMEHVKALRSRPRATAYVIPRGLPNEAEILQVVACHAMEAYSLPAGSTVVLRQYRLTGEEVCLSEEEIRCFARGAYVFPNTVPSTVAGVIMEPDFDAASENRMNLRSMELVEADEDGNLPLYRYCHDLQDGKVSVEQ